MCSYWRGWLGGGLPRYWCGVLINTILTCRVKYNEWDVSVNGTQEHKNNNFKVFVLKFQLFMINIDASANIYDTEKYKSFASLKYFEVIFVKN